MSYGDSGYYRRPRREHSAGYGYGYDYDHASSYAPTSARRVDSYDSPASYHPRRTAAQHPHSHYTPRPPTWPPAPTVEDELSTEGEPPAETRGTVDQDSLLDAIEPPDNGERRFVLVPDANPNPRRRRSIAERGNLPHLQTHVDQTHLDNDPPMVTERVSTPYSYTKPQRETTAPDFLLSPEPMTPAPSTRLDVFDDDDLEPDQTAHLRTERAPARYSFVKSDLHKEHLRTDLRDSQSRPASPKEAPSRRRDSGHRSARPDPPQQSPHSQSPHQQSPHQQSPHQQSPHQQSPRQSPYQQSPRSSSSSLNSEKRRARNAPVNASRPASPLPRASPASSRPVSRGNTGPTFAYPPSPSYIPVTDADWHATYPPVTANDRSRPPSRFGRTETMPAMPRVDIQSPSPARPPTSNPLPYPVDDRQAEVFMPPEAHYQFDHSSVASPRRAYPDLPRVSSPAIPASPRHRDLPLHSSRPRTPTEIPLRTRRSRTDSLRSHSSFDAPPQPPSRSTPTISFDRPLPSCPRGTPTDRYDDWYNLEGFWNFDVCPSCYEGVFAGTPFASRFSQPRRYERAERSCDFHSPWMRLAWLLTIKQRRPSLELLYALASIAESDRPCPGDREASSDRVAWYGIPDQRDGIHVANFAVCSCDVKMIEVLFPSVRGYFTRLPSGYRTSQPERYTCSLRIGSQRFPKYLDLLVELEAEASTLDQPPAIGRFIKLARDNAFKGECAKSKAFIRKPWHFIPALPAFTVCEECYDAIIWPATQSANTPPTIPRLVNKSIQLVPGEDLELGSSCCLYSPRMRRVWETSVAEQDFGYLERKVLERKRAENRLARERKGIVKYMVGLERDGREWARAREDLKSLEREWAAWE